MNKNIVMLMLVFSLGIGSVKVSLADHTTHPEIVRALRTNAEAVKRDAAIYQRKHVSSNVARIVEDTKRLQKKMAVHGCLKEDAEAIQKAVTELRSASLNADAGKTTDAVKHLSDLADGVLKKYCKDDKSAQ